MTERELLVEAAPGAGPFDVIGEHYLNLPGTTGANASTPDTAALDITGDIDVRVDARLPQWHPATDDASTVTVGVPLIGKWDFNGGQRSWVLCLPVGTLMFAWSTSGTNATVNAGIVLAPTLLTPGRRLILRVTLDVNDGAGGNVVTFMYTDPATGGTIDAGPWTTIQTGSGAVAGTTSIFNSTSPLQVGEVSDPFGQATPLTGKVYQVQVRSSIGGSIVANPSFQAQPNGTTSFADSAGRTWTLNGSAAIAGYDWVDLSDRAVSASWDIGRDDELDDFPSTQATVVLRNKDRYLDPDYPASPYAGKLLPRVPVRIRSRNTTTSAVDDEFYGFVEGGWQQVAVSPANWRCELRLGDLLSVMSGTKLPDIFDQSVLDREPLGYWVLESATDAELVTDLGSGRNDGTVTGQVQFGERPVRAGHDESALFEAPFSAEPDRSPSYIDITSGSSLITGSMIQSTVVATVRARKAATLSVHTLFVQGNGNTATTGVQFAIDSAGRPNYTHLTNGAGTNYQWPTSIVDNKGHLVFGGGNGVAVDTAILSTATAAGGVVATNGVGIGGHSGVVPENNWDGWIGAVAVFGRRLGQGEREFIVGGYNRLDGETSDKHISWALDQLGVPPEMRTVETGTVVMGPANTRDRDGVDWMREVARTEGGGLYIDHRGGGKVRYRARYARFLDSRSVASQATFSDVDAAAVIRIARDGVDIAPNGLDAIVNQVTVTWRDGTVTVEDSASIARYGPRPRQIDTQATTPAQARSAGEWVLARYAQPRSRTKGLQALPRTRLNRPDLLQNLRIDDRATVRLRPAQVGDPSLTGVYIDGISNRVERSVEWHTGIRFAQAESFTPWIWGTSAWGTGTYWG